MDRRRVMSLIKTALTGFDKPLSLIVFLLFATGIVALYSAAIDMPGRVEDQLRNILLSYVVMFVIAYLPTQTLMRVAVPMYTPSSPGVSRIASRFSIAWAVSIIASAITVSLACWA